MVWSAVAKATGSWSGIDGNVGTSWDGNATVWDFVSETNQTFWDLVGAGTWTAISEASTTWTAS